MKDIIVTTSWDDGHVLDERLAELLKKYGIKGTFYISPKDRELKSADRMKSAQIKKLSRDFEIGSHTMTHPVMTELTDRQIKSELVRSRDYLKKVTGKAVKSFCYPRGAYKQSMLPLVEAAGYTYARTTKNYELGKPADRLQAGASIEVHRMAIPRLPKELLDVFLYSDKRPDQFFRNLTWKGRAINMFDRVTLEGGVFHLWGHSWVIDREKKWDQLEEVLAYIHARPGVRYLTNGQLAKERRK